MASDVPYSSVSGSDPAPAPLINPLTETMTSFSAAESILDGEPASSKRRVSSPLNMPDKSRKDRTPPIAENETSASPIDARSRAVWTGRVKLPSSGPSLSRRTSAASWQYSNSRDGHTPVNLVNLQNPVGGSPSPSSRRSSLKGFPFPGVEDCDRNEEPTLESKNRISSQKRPTQLQRAINSPEWQMALLNSFGTPTSNRRTPPSQPNISVSPLGESASQGSSQQRRRSSAPVKPFVKEESSEVDCFPVLAHFPEFKADGLLSEPFTGPFIPAVDPGGFSTVPSRRRYQRRSTFSRGDLPPCELFPYRCVDNRSKDRKSVGTVTNNKKILERIQRGTNVSKKRKQPFRISGHVYIYESTYYAKGHVKIGQSKNTGETRINLWETKCGMMLDEVKDVYEDSFDWYKLVETLIFYELHNFRKILVCDSPRCRRKPQKASRRVSISNDERDREYSSDEDSGREEIDDVDPIQSYPRKGHHTEWFEKPPRDALHILNRWRTWILVHHPFDDYGQLTKYWQYRAEKIQNCLREQEWDSWTQPPWFDYFCYCLWSVRKTHKEVWPRVKRHLKRKDLNFYYLGLVVVLLLWLRFGFAVAFGTVILLLVL